MSTGKGEEIKRHWPTGGPVAGQIIRPRGYYAKVAIFFFGVGAGIEFFMILSGFYKQELKTEEDLEKALKKKEKRRMFLENLQKQAKEKYEQQQKGKETEGVSSKIAANPATKADKL